jgi:hypothetical protein
MGGPAKKLTLQIRAIEPLCARDDLLAIADAGKIVVTQRDGEAKIDGLKSLSGLVFALARTLRG